MTPANTAPRHKLVPATLDTSVSLTFTDDDDDRTVPTMARRELDGRENKRNCSDARRNMSRSVMFARTFAS